MPNSTSLIREINPLLDLHRKPVYGFDSGGESIDIRSYTADSVSNSSIGFSSIYPASTNTVIDRRFMMETSFLVTLNGDSGDPNTLLINLGVTDAARCLPLLQATQNIQMQLNGTSISSNIGSYIEPLLRYNQERKELFSGALEKHDFYQEYSDFVTEGSAQNVLGKNENGYEDLRGAHEYEILTNTQFQCEVVVKTFTPICISPLTWSKHAQPGLTGIQSMTLTLNFYPNLINRIWSRAEDLTSVITSSSVSLIDPRLTKPTLHLNTILPKHIDAVPSKVYYDYEHIERFEHGSGILSAGQRTSLNANNVKLNAIPNKVFIFCKRSDQTRGIGKTDTYLKINNISVDFDSRSGLMAQSDSNDLYNISRSNGLSMTLNEWSKYTGSVLCLDFSKDISFNSLVASGAGGSYQFACRLDVENVGSQDFGYTFQTVFVYPGVMSIDNQMVSLSTSIVSPTELGHLNNFEVVVNESEMQGGSFSGKIGDYSKKIINYAKSDQGKKMASNVAKVAKIAGPVLASLIGLGYTENEARQIVERGGTLGSGLGSGLIGGSKKASKKSLYDRL